HQDRVAVGLGLGDNAAADIAAGAHAVVGDDALTPHFAQFLPDQASDDVSGATRGKGNDDGNGSFGPVGGKGGGGAQSCGKQGSGQQQGGAPQRAKTGIHINLLVLLCMMLLCVAWCEKYCLVISKETSRGGSLAQDSAAELPGPIAKRPAPRG